MRETSKSWILTYPRMVHFDVADPRVSMIEAADIAHHLSHLCRFTGGIPRFYSVAQHCYLVSLRAEEIAAQQRRVFLMNQNSVEAWITYCARAGLLHDAAEAYVADLNTPTKSLPEMAPYREVEDHVLDTILEKYGLGPLPLPHEVHQADEELFLAECQDVRGDSVRGARPVTGVLAERIRPWSPAKARRVWRRRFRGLFPAWAHEVPGVWWEGMLGV